MGWKGRFAKILASQTNPHEVTQMVSKRKQHNSPTPAKQGLGATAPKPNKISAATSYDFRGRKPTPYGGLLPVVERALI